MGVFYAGFDYKNRKNGYFKIGETSGSTPAQRLSQIRRIDSFQCLGYIILINETKPQRLYVESYVRMKLPQECPELQPTQNDHYFYSILSKDTKYSQAQHFADVALKLAIEACEKENISYKIGTKKYKRG